MEKDNQSKEVYETEDREIKRGEAGALNETHRKYTVII